MCSTFFPREQLEFDLGFRQELDLGLGCFWGVADPTAYIDTMPRHSSSRRETRSQSLRAASSSHPAADGGNDGTIDPRQLHIMSNPPPAESMEAPPVFDTATASYAHGSDLAYQPPFQDSAFHDYQFDGTANSPPEMSGNDIPIDPNLESLSSFSDLSLNAHSPGIPANNYGYTPSPSDSDAHYAGPSIAASPWADPNSTVAYPATTSVNAYTPTGNIPSALDAQYETQQQDNSDFSDGALGPPFLCHDPGCGESFGRKCDRDKHNKKHTKPIGCEYCPEGYYQGTAQKRDWHRHMWTNHPETARELDVPKEEGQCPTCGQRGRKDNIRRHRKQLRH
ncbi:hypothetical protein B0T24DRAFT_701526 [Lasiosphaeria ovina]|uniref:C2H2-type domain-containing protein n=1 Tax=Lasiosphaeria ovina TaxID=92902 RepID=A0AAE0KJ93_9PEZI|nr:hypothetical protein B0T24DRAFT_701526 [Lasiosphaeria ovina]